MVVTCLHLYIYLREYFSYPFVLSVCLKTLIVEPNCPQLHSPNITTVTRTPITMKAHDIGGKLKSNHKG